MTWNSYDTGSGISWYGEGTEGRAFNVIFGECFVGEYPRGEKPRGEIFKRWVAKMSRPDTFDLCCARLPMKPNDSVNGPIELMKKIPQDMKKCPRCKRILYLASFRVKPSPQGDRVRTYCKRCEARMAIVDGSTRWEPILSVDEV